MTTLGRYQGMTEILARLEAVRQRHLTVQIVHSAAGAVTVVGASIVLLGLVGFWPGQPPRALRMGLLIAAGALWAAAAAWFVLLPIRRRVNHAQAARLVEERIGGLDNALINAIQLDADRGQVSRPLVQQAISETVRRTDGAALPSAVGMIAARRWLISAAVAVAVVAGFAGLAGPRLSRGLAAVFHPGAYVRHLSTVKLISLEPGDTSRFAGESLTVIAKIENPDRRRYEARVEIADPPARRAMVPYHRASDGATTTYSCQLGRVEQTFQYAVWIGDSRFPADRPYYTVRVLQRVEVRGLDLTYQYPEYTHMPAKKVAGAAGPVEAPVGTLVKVTLRLSAAVPAAVLDTRGGIRSRMRADEGSNVFTGQLRVLADDAYRILLTDKAGRTLQQLPDVGGSDWTAPAMADGFYRIRALPDRPPKVAFIEPNRDVSVVPGGRLAACLKASDDYGLEKVRFFLGREGEAPRPAHDFADAVGKKSATLEYTIEVAGEYREGDVIVYYAAAADGRRLGDLGGPQTTESPRFKIVVQDAAKVAAERAKRYDRLRARLLKILAAQESERVNTEIAARKLTDVVQVRSAAGRIAAAQQTIRLDMLDLVDNFPFEAEMVTIQQALAMLGNNEAAMAVAQARVLASIGELSARPSACDRLAGTQDRIIRALHALLAILPSLQHPESVRKTPGGGDIPPEVRQKLAALKTALEKFIEAQQKIVRASDRLVKRPVDNFTSEEDKLLKELELAQDKWEKFLNEKFTDFSKLAQQDFSNPSMLKELISVKTDVTMAKDALKKKATEIATAIEDNGIENARTLTANIEKWLPDEPDRIKWNMEDPAGQENIEQPELPKELEDLVGDLLEDEEDLFEDMDDISSKYTMSGDKGIGWDAMDGPISSMNAQGVTGNQLPNTSEISGRSGEGRQGKSLGEFVEDKAVGKGGRRTPTRLTPEPFQTGQVNDTSKEPAGGASGGGKLSGAGSEGLEGPLPPELQKQLKRLAGQHAQLLNRAERMRATFKVSDYSHYKFLEAVTLMSRVQRDLVHFRYTNALRRRHVTLGALRRTHLLLTGKIDVTTDATANRPKYVKDDITDARKPKLPAEFGDALQKYFQRLAESGK